MPGNTTSINLSLMMNITSKIRNEFHGAISDCGVGFLHVDDGGGSVGLRKLCLALRRDPALRFSYVDGTGCGLKRLAVRPKPGLPKA